ncbi:MAG: RplW 50S ribosomal protein L23, large subunit ribosomal protein L23 [Candidatus Wolfebacteria bacterium GW2011_GWC1_43_10]|uniref:Large ribosomal subunit protein uL23 n=2 Tax=Candidatus Wolfeibacteriota TaxID=1752735 RepID=A0A0G1C7Z1_9BACT|nr:MAG: RplW 50S ribosomal protein L23, large subunit ribosomal protein L23 [Candidatus Wolfebacteria bacterium GW2011_GWC1_43_10]KKT22958.1 MAG: 50S ribosomal protein L23 [Parcubacteria group bacterium GW2011_GWB1_43_8b]
MGLFKKTKKEEKEKKEKNIPTSKVADVKIKNDGKNRQHLLIHQPLITEKTMALSEMGKYVFLVSREANKSEAKKQIEKLYSVNVTGVSSLKKKPKPKYFKGIEKEKPGLKKIIVTLKKGQKIEITGNK